MVNDAVSHGARRNPLGGQTKQLVWPKDSLRTVELVMEAWERLPGGGGRIVGIMASHPGAFTPVPEVTGLLERLDASPVRGIGVEVRGRIIGRGMPGYVLSPDLVVQDESGFVPLVYRQPIPLARGFFGLFRAQSFLGSEVVARGWYRRLPGPAIELRELTTAEGRKARSYAWVFRYISAGVLVLVGLFVALAGLGG